MKPGVPIQNALDVHNCRISVVLAALREHADRWLPPALRSRTSTSIPQQTLQVSGKPEQARPTRTLEESLGDSQGSEPKTFLYLAYGSNLSAETFQGKRGIRPLNAVNVVVPSLRMTFDLPGLPYGEPCFANSGRRIPGEKLDKRYRKNRWTKGMVGVVYELTPKDFYHVLATEGGGASYQDVLVECHQLVAGSRTVPEIPETSPFLSHTLFAPASDPSQPDEPGGRFHRPDPSYAQSSARYLKLIRDGANEHDLPEEYKAYLMSLQPYQANSQKQQLGRFIFMLMWGPFILLIFALAKAVSDDKGHSPSWLIALTGGLFKAMWKSYDGYFKGVFGDGERTTDASHVEISQDSKDVEKASGMVRNEQVPEAV